GFAWAGVGRVTIGAQAGTVEPGLGQGIDDLLLSATEHVRHYRGRRDPYQQYMAKSHAVEAVLQRDHALNLMRLDHRGQYIAHDKWRLSCGHIALRQIIRHRQNAAEVVGRMAPFRSEPGVIVIQPTDDAADVPRRLHRIQPKL